MAQYLAAESGMRFYSFKLLIGQPARLAEDIVGYAYLAAVVRSAI